MNTVKIKRTYIFLIAPAILVLLFLWVRSTYATHSADFDGDGRVDQADLAILIDQWSDPFAGTTADLNHDGRVDARDAGILFSSWGTVAPPPPPPSESKLLFFGSNGWTPGAEAIVNEILGENAAAYIHTGDLDFSVGPYDEPGGGPCNNWPELAFYCQNGSSIHTQEERRAGYRTMMASIMNSSAPLYVAWGNHEYDGDSPKGDLQTYYRDTFGTDFAGQKYYAFDIQSGAGPARVIVLDTAGGSLAEGTTQRTWLENELNEAQSYAWRIVVGHSIAYTRFKPLPSLTEFPYQLFSDKKVDLYIGGHPLAWERSKQIKFDVNSQDYAAIVDSDDSLEQGAGVVYVTIGGSGMHPYQTLYGPEAVNSRGWDKTTLGGWTYGVLNWSTDGRILTVTAKGFPGNPASQYPAGPLQTVDTVTITQP